MSRLCILSEQKHLGLAGVHQLLRPHVRHEQPLLQVRSGLSSVESIQPTEARVGHGDLQTLHHPGSYAVRQAGHSSGKGHQGGETK